MDLGAEFLWAVVRTVLGLFVDIFVDIFVDSAREFRTHRRRKADAAVAAPSGQPGDDGSYVAL